MNRILTPESVSEGHPDKVCDYIADSILDVHLYQDSGTALLQHGRPSTRS